MLELRTKQNQEQVIQFQNEFISPYTIKRKNHLNLLQKTSLDLEPDTDLNMQSNEKNKHCNVPKVLHIPDRKIFEFAKEQYSADRQNGAKVIRNLVRALEQIEINLKRRKKLVLHSRKY